MKPFFSIVIPTLNEELFLPNLLKDLGKQKSKNFDVIVVDANSHDKTRQVAESWKGLPIQFFKDKKNISSQRNFGALKAKGSYLVFLDADSRISSSFTDRLERIIFLKKGLFFVPSIKTDDSIKETQFVIDVVNFLIGLSQNLGRPFALGGAMIIEKNYFFTLNGFDEKIKLAEDYDLALRSFQWGVRAKFLDTLYVTFSMRRFRREGSLETYYKYLVSNVQYLVSGKVNPKKITYETGGHLYNRANNSDKFYSIKSLKSLLKKTKKNINNFMKE